MRRVSVYWPGAIGNVVEWYDFALYGFLAPLFATLFFSHENAWFGLVVVYAILAASFLARPLGGFFYGYIGDRFGRRKALIWSVGLMTGLSCLLGLLPAEKTIGIAAPILLVIIRILQGLSAGGEISGSFIYVLESVPEKKRGIYGGATWCMVVVGILLGSGVLPLIHVTMTDAHFTAFGWRLAYFVGAILGMTAMFMRFMMPESKPFMQLLEKKKVIHNPLSLTFRSHKKLLGKILMLMAVAAAGFYLPFLYLPVFANQYLHIAKSATLTLNTITQVFLVGGLIFFGWLTDKLGKQRLLVISAVGTLIISYPLLYWIKMGGLYHFFVGQLVFALLVASFEAPLPQLLIRLIPVEVRYSTLAIGYNVGFALFGGFSPLMSTLLIRWTNNAVSPAYYLMGCAVISLLSLWRLRRAKSNC